MGKDLEIKKGSNSLFRSGKSKPLPPSSQKIELMLISSDYEMEERSRLFSVQDLSKCGIKGNQFKRDVKVAVDSLKNYEVRVQEGKSLFVTRLVSGATYNPDGSVEVFFEPKLKPYLIELKNNFTLFSFQVALGLNKCKHSLNFYKFFESYLHAGADDIGSEWYIKDCSIQDLLEVSGLSESSYKKDIAKFIKNILEMAIDELNTSSNIFITKTHTKTGRSVSHISFTLKRKLWQPSFDALFEEGLSTIPPNIQSILDEIQYKTLGKSKDYIITHIVRYGAEVVLNSLNDIAHWNHKEFRSKMVKSLLPVYCDRYFRESEDAKKLERQGLDQEKIAKLQILARKRLENEFDEWSLLNEADYLELKNNQLKIVPIMKDHPELLERISKDAWITKRLEDR